MQSPMMTGEHPYIIQNKIFFPECKWQAFMHTLAKKKKKSINVDLTP